MMRTKESSITNKFSRVLQKLGFNREAIELVKIEIGNRELEVLQHKMGSIYRINQSIKEKFDSVYPIELSITPETRAYYVPIRENLESILQHPSVFSKVIESLKEPNDGQKSIIKSYRDGIHHLKCEFRKHRTNVVDLILYVDEFNLCDSLSKHMKTQKMFAIYFSIGNQLIYIN